MDLIDLNGLVTIEETPVCPICGLPMYLNDICAMAHANDMVFLAHYKCADVEFFNA